MASGYYETVLGYDITLEGLTIEGPEDMSARIVNPLCGDVFNIYAPSVTITHLTLEERDGDGAICEENEVISLWHDPESIWDASSAEISYNVITGGYRGVYLSGHMEDVTITSNTISESTYGIRSYGGKRTVIDDNTIIENFIGIRFDDHDCSEEGCESYPEDVIIQFNNISYNDEDGLNLDEGKRTIVSGNAFFENGHDSEFGGGIYISDIGLDGTEIDTNTFINNVSYGIYISAEETSAESPISITNNTILQDTVGEDTRGIDVNGDYISITENSIAGYAEGIRACSDYLNTATISENTLGAITIEDTSFPGNTIGLGMYCGDTVTVERNTFSGNEVGLHNFSTETVTAQYNYWGAASGPTNLTNPEGSGDQLNENDGIFTNPYTYGEEDGTYHFLVTLSAPNNNVIYRPFFSDEEMTTEVTGENIPFTLTRAGVSFGESSVEESTLAQEDSEGLLFGEYTFTSDSPLSCGRSYLYRYDATLNDEVFLSTTETFIADACTDNEGPEIVTISAEAEETTATLSFETNERSSYLPRIGTHLDLLEELFLEDDAFTTAEHTAEFDELTPCTKYYVTLELSDSLGNVSTDTVAEFTTQGCPGNAEMVNIGTEIFDPEESELFGLSAEDFSASIFADEDFFILPTAFQMSLFIADEVFDGMGDPARTTLASSHLAQVNAFVFGTNLVETLSEPISVSVNYDAELVPEEDLEKLFIYSYRNHHWSKLSDCTTDTEEYRITCTTDEPGLFGAFIQEDRRSSSSAPATPPRVVSETPEGTVPTCTLPRKTTSLNIPFSCTATGSSTRSMSFTETYQGKTSLSSGRYTSKDTLLLREGAGEHTIVITLTSQTGEILTLPTFTVTVEDAHGQISTSSQSPIHRDDATSSYDTSRQRFVAEDSGEVDSSGRALSRVASGWFVRSEQFSTVYYIDSSYVRHPLWDTQTFFTWADSWDDITWVTDATLATMPLGKPVLPKSGVVLVKLESDPSVYAVDEDTSGNSILRRVPSEEDARALFGSSWQSYVIDIPPTIFPHFGKGSPLTKDEAWDAGGMLSRAQISAASL